MTVFLYSYFLACVAYVILSIVLVRRQVRKLDRRTFDSLHPVAKFVFTGGFPIGLAVFMFYVFVIAGIAPTVQFNAGSHSGMRAWSMWVGIWPFALVLSLINALGNLVWVIVCAVVKSRRALIWVAFASFVLAMLAISAVFIFAPTA